MRLGLDMATGHQMPSSPAGRQSDVLQGHQETLALHEGEADVDAAGVAQLAVSVEDDVVQLGEDAIHEAARQG